jgi:hypothetical protein
VLPPINGTFPTPWPITIFITDYYYLAPSGVSMTTQPSATINTGSPITLGPDRILFTSSNGFLAGRLTINSDLSSNYGFFSFQQVNDFVTQGTGFSFPLQLKPQELSVTFTQVTSFRISGTDVSGVINLPVTVNVRYNPHGVILAGVAIIPDGALALAASLGNTVVRGWVYGE